MLVGQYGMKKWAALEKELCMRTWGKTGSRTVCCCRAGKRCRVERDGKWSQHEKNHMMLVREREGKEQHWDRESESNLHTIVQIVMKSDSSAGGEQEGWSSDWRDGDGGSSGLSLGLWGRLWIQRHTHTQRKHTSMCALALCLPFSSLFRDLFHGVRKDCLFVVSFFPDYSFFTQVVFPCSILLSTSFPLFFLSPHAVFSLCLPHFLPIPQLLSCVLCISKKKKMKPNKLEPQEGDWWLRKAPSLHLFSFSLHLYSHTPYLPSPSGTVALIHSHTHTHTHKRTNTLFV